MTPEERIELLCRRHSNDLRDDMKIILRQALTESTERCVKMVEAEERIPTATQRRLAAAMRASREEKG